MTRGQMILNFEVEGGVVKFDVVGGDGQNCAILAEVFTEEGGEVAMERKPEYNKAHKAARKTTA